jgi:hypothetical protein
MTYVPKPLLGTKDVNGVQSWAEREFSEISRNFNEADAVDLRQTHKSPKKPRVGMVAYADGTDWDPGSGEGLYVYKSGGWTFIV